MKKTTPALALAMSAGLATSTLARPNFPEIEPNETKGQATMVVGMAPGDTLSGNSTGTSTTVAGAASADTFLIKVAPAPLGLYRNRLVITTTGTAGHAGSIRGLNQVAAAQAPWLPGMVIGTPGVTDTTIQSSSATSTPPRFNQWYGFGKEEEIYYRITGTTSTTSDYLVTLEQLPIAPTPIASTFAPGDITITTLGQGHSSDTDIHVYDANFNPIVGSSNDDEAATAVSGVPGATGTTLQSVLKRSYAPGTYYLAIGSFNTCNNLPSPSDDDFRTGAILDFPNALVTSSTATNVNVSFSISDGAVTTPVPSTRAGIYDINWYSFTVGGVVGACCVPTTLTCVETSAGNCSILGGTYNGDGSTCATANCPTPGACCLPDGSCIQALPAACTAQNGTYQGNSVQCGSVQCPQPALGACCLPDGTCAQLFGPSCIAQNGIFGGNNSPCSTANCAKGYVYVGAAVPIADGTGSTQCGTPALASVTVTESFTITGIEAAYFITHTFQGDLKVSLEKVSGPSVTMVDRPGVPAATFGFGTDNYGASNSNAGYFISNDTAANIYDAPATTGVNNPVGRWKAENAMAAFVGLDSAGDWNLKVEDCAGGDTGNIVGFVLLLNMAPMGGGGCYANCDQSTVVPFLNVNDFVCFNNAFAANDTYANCDLSTNPPILNVNDFICFNNAFAAGCSAP